MMMLSENIRLALSSLKANKMRALLTMLGIIIGIGSVIAIMTVGDSVTSTVTDSMDSLGINNITITVQQRSDDDETSELGMLWSSDDSTKTPDESDYITADMLESLLEAYPDEITAFSITESLGSGEIQTTDDTLDINVSGVTLGYFLANNVDLLSGVYFSEKDLTDGAMVALISSDVVDEFFDGEAEAAVGETLQVQVNGQYYNFVVEGVYEDDGDETATMFSYFMNGSASRFYIPLKTAQNLGHTSGYQTLTAIVSSDANPDETAAKIEDYFDNLYRNNEDFEVSAQSLSSMVSIMERMLSTITTAIAMIGGIALVVGGIGVMNIMLVSITERTREIGTRKALGAPNSSIRMQFIIESIVICIIGGIIGIILGCIGGIAAADYLGTSATPSISSIVISLDFSMAIGIFFGYYPANKAAKLNPIDALRYE